MGTLHTKRIAFNTLFLYVRMLILMFVAFYTSRVLLRELGINDFGLYGVVGGTVAIFSSLRGLFATATQRFLNFEMGRNNANGLNTIFNISLFINIIICIVFFICAEIIGLWFLENKLIIAPERMDAAKWAFHFSVLASMISILTIPFDALIIAHEKMSFYAYVSILDACLKLGVIFILPYFAIDKLKLYAALIVVVSLVIRFISSVYCKRNFPECKYKFCWDKKTFKEMGTFAGWNFAGNLAFALVNEGLNILLNLFGGVIANAARSIAYQVKNAITAMLSNIMIAVAPQATQLYAQGEKQKFYSLLFTASKIIVFFYLMMAFPLYFYTHEILQIWLGTIPKYAPDFIQAILIYLMIRSFHGPIDAFFLTIGKLKTYQVTELLILSLSLPISYLALKYYDFPLYVVFYIMSIIEFINLLLILKWAIKIGGFDLKQYFYQVIFPCLYTFICASSILYSIQFYIHSQKITNINCIIISIIIQFIIFMPITFFIGFSSKERAVIKSVVKKKKQDDK